MQGCDWWGWGWVHCGFFLGPDQFCLSNLTLDLAQNLNRLLCYMENIHPTGSGENGKVPVLNGL